MHIPPISEDDDSVNVPQDTKDSVTRSHAVRNTWIVMLVSVTVMMIAGAWIIIAGMLTPQEPVVTPLGNLDSIINSPTPTPSPAQSGNISPSPSVSPYPSLTATAIPVMAAPVNVRIPKLNVKADVIPTGLLKDKSMEIPDDIMKVGWFRYSVNPGSPNGSAVIAGHRDGRAQGHGAFYSIGDLTLGDTIYVRLADGTVITYEVAARNLVSVDNWSKVAPKLFSDTGRPRLTLISCGGYYDRNAGGYQSNIIITATPIATIPPSPSPSTSPSSDMSTFPLNTPTG